MFAKKNKSTAYESSRFSPFAARPVAALIFPITACIILSFCGCADPAATAEKPVEKPQNIMGRKTQDIGEWDPNGDAEEADQQVKVSANPLASAGAYGYAVGTISKQHIQQAVNLYWAEHGEYPKTYEEFMEKIVKANNIELPVLPGGDMYQYDVENHQLLVIEGGKKSDRDDDQ